MKIWNGNTTPPNELAPAWESEDMNTMRAIELFADELMEDCKVFKNAKSVNEYGDLYDGDFLTKLIVEIASWDGSTESANVQIRKLHNLLADELQKIAEREFK